MLSLNLGMIDRDNAKKILLEEVVLSEPMALQEIDRYTFNSPGQAGAYTVWPAARYRSIQPRQLCGVIHNPWMSTTGGLRAYIVL